MTATEWAKTPAIDASEYHNVELSFYRWLNVQSADRASVEVSADGADWTTIWQNSTATSLSESSWNLQTFDLSSVADGNPTVFWQLPTAT